MMLNLNFKILTLMTGFVLQGHIYIKVNRYRIESRLKVNQIVSLRIEFKSNSDIFPRSPALYSCVPAHIIYYAGMASIVQLCSGWSESMHWHQLYLWLVSAGRGGAVSGFVRLVCLLLDFRNLLRFLLHVCLWSQLCRHHAGTLTDTQTTSSSQRRQRETHRLRTASTHSTKLKTQEKCYSTCFQLLIIQSQMLQYFSYCLLFHILCIIVLI